MTHAFLGWIFPNQVMLDYLMSECPVQSYSSSKVSQSGYRSHYVVTIDVLIEGGVIKVFQTQGKGVRD
jgi:hypothetical protein